MNQTIMNDSISKPIDEQKLNHILSKYGNPQLDRVD